MTRPKVAEVSLVPRAGFLLLLVYFFYHFILLLFFFLNNYFVGELFPFYEATKRVKQKIIVKFHKWHYNTNASYMSTKYDVWMVHSMTWRARPLISLGTSIISIPCGTAQDVSPTQRAQSAGNAFARECTLKPVLTRLSIYFLH